MSDFIIVIDHQQLESCGARTHYGTVVLLQRPPGDDIFSFCENLDNSFSQNLNSNPHQLVLLRDCQSYTMPTKLPGN